MALSGRPSRVLLEKGIRRIGRRRRAAGHIQNFGTVVACRLMEKKVETHRVLKQQIGVGRAPEKRIGARQILIN